MKILFFVSIFFGIYSVKLLLDEQFDVDYVNELNATHEHESLRNKSCFRIFTCLDLKSEFNILNYKSEIKIDQLITQLIDHLNSTKFAQDIFKDLKQRNLTIEVRTFREVLDINFLNPLKYKKFYIFNQNVCLLYTNLKLKDELISFGLIFSFFKNKNLILLKNNLSNYNILSMNDFFYFSFEEPKQFLVSNKPYPYSNCKLIDERTNEKYSKFVCLNRCFRSKYKSLRYFYDANETETINLDFNLNQTIIEHEKSCFDQCKRDDCELNSLVLSDKDYVFTARPLISDIHFYIQLVGLILSFTNLSFYQLFLKIIKPNVKIKKLERFNLFFDFISDLLNRFQFYQTFKTAFELFLKAVFFVFCLLSFAYLSFNLYNEHNFKIKNPTRREILTNLIEPEPFKIVTCAYADNILINNHTSSPDSKLYLDKTFFELEATTNDGFNQTIENVYLEFNSKKEQIHWQLTSNVLFKYIPSGLLRCFELKVYPSESKYRSLLSISKLVIKYKHENALFFFLTENENFNSKSFYFINNSFQKKVIRKSKTNENEKCYNYEIYDCKDRSSCIEKYAIRTLLQKYSKISYGMVINKEYFNEFEWSSTRIKGILDHDEIPYDAYKYFYNNFTSPDCFKTFFEKDLKVEPTNSRIELDIYYKQVTFIEDETTIYKLLFDLFALQGILFGLNVFDLFVIVSHFLRIKSKVWKSLYFAFVYTFCGLSLCIHIYLIFDQIINEELIKNQHYELTDSVDAQELRFCFNYEKNSIRSNANSTGNDLEEMTNHMRVENVFKRVYYLNKFNEWIRLDKKSKFRNNELSIDVSYFLDKKCFIAKLNLTYEKSQFHFLQTTNIFKADFNLSFLNKHQDIFFFTNPKEKRQFSKLIKIKNQNNFKYQIKQEIFDIKQNDRFVLIKNPLYLFSSQNYSHLNDPDIYLNNLLNDFKKKHNSTTLQLPLERENFDLNINDDLFEEFQAQAFADNKMKVNLNYERRFATNYLQMLPNTVTPNDAYFTFSFSFLKKKVLISNAENYAKLILSLVNVLGLWFNFNLLETLSFKSKLCKQSKLNKSVEDAFKKIADQKVNQMVGEIANQMTGEPDNQTNEHTDQGSDRNSDQNQNLKPTSNFNPNHKVDNEDKNDKKFADKQTQTCKQTITLKLNLESNELQFSNQIDHSNPPELDLDRNENIYSNAHLYNETDLHESNQPYSNLNMKSTEL